MKSFNIQGNRLLKYTGDEPCVTLPEQVEIIAEAAFFGAENLKEIHFPDGLKEISFHAFYGCNRLENLTLPAGLTLVDDRAFAKCKALTRVEFKGLPALGADVFCACDNITEPLGNFFEEDGFLCLGSTLVQYRGRERQIVIPQRIHSIAGYAFSQCDSLQELTLPASLSSINDFAFANCRKLRTITFERSALSFGHCVFYNCPALRDIRVPRALLSPGPLDRQTISNDELKRTLFLSCLKHPQDFAEDQKAQWESWLLETKDKITVYAIEKDDIFALKFYLDRDALSVDELNQLLELSSRLERPECTARLLEAKKTKEAPTAGQSLFDILGEF